MGNHHDDLARLMSEVLTELESSYGIDADNVGESLAIQVSDCLVSWQLAANPQEQHTIAVNIAANIADELAELYGINEEDERCGETLHITMPKKDGTYDSDFLFVNGIEVAQLLDPLEKLEIFAALDRLLEVMNDERMDEDE